MMRTRSMRNDPILPTFPQLYPSLEEHKWTLIYLSSSSQGKHESLSESLLASRMYLTSPGQMLPSYFMYSSGPLDGICCQFNAYAQWKPYLYKLRTAQSDRPLLIHNLEISQQIEYILQRLMEYGEHSNHPDYQQLSFHCLSEVFLLLTMHVKQPSLLLDPRINEIQHYLNQHYTEDIRIEELAQLVCLSPSRLSHLYKEQTSETLIDTILRLRMEQAQYLLRFTSRYIGEIAYDVGFNSQTYFTCKFTSYVGVSPSVYRTRSGGEIHV